MKKKIIPFFDFFKEKPPLPNQEELHLWVGKARRPSHEILNHLLNQYLKNPIPKINLQPSGKPYLEDSLLQFNLSDSEDWLAIAFSWQDPVGVDIERIRSLEGMEKLISDHFSQKEQDYVYSKGNENLTTRFWQIWNRKEACLKSLGLGLQNDLATWDSLHESASWTFVKGAWVHSYPMTHRLSLAIAFSKEEYE